MNNEFRVASHPYDVERTQKSQKNNFAVASLVLGIVSVTACCCCCLETIGLILTGISAVLAIVFSFLAPKNSEGKTAGKAIAGLVLGIVGIGMLLMLLFAIVSTYSMIGQIPEEEMLIYLEENLKPLLEGNEKVYNELVEAVKAIYTQREKS